ncbi:hypothetical protein MSPP1_002757 [Malassezia sp. CBS 17886]|nr:hypothetical protein MSPP1_002757 [Malassezia sp. CBS 17886]
MSAGPVSPAPMSGDAFDIVRPSKEWVLPERGKPGRKPAASPPLTKRKAQNRASQRAFRERRHAYVSELEEKVARFEAREIEGNVQMQRLAQQYRADAEALRAENARLSARCTELETTAANRGRADADGCVDTGEPMRAAGVRRASDASQTHKPLTPLATSRDRGFGCRAPQHETFTNPPPKRETHPSTPVSPPPPTPSDDDDLSLDCGFCPDPEICVCRGKARLQWDDDAVMAPLPIPRLGAANGTPHLWPTRTAETPAAVALHVRRAPGKRRLWETVSSAGAARDAAPATGAPRDATAPAAPCSGDPSNCTACGTDPALAAFCTEIVRKAPQQQNAAPTTATGQVCESIPQAFTRIRRHPNFAQFSGGLTLLADIVSRDADTDGEATPPPRKRARNTTFSVRSTSVSEALALLDERGRPTGRAASPAGTLVAASSAAPSVTASPGAGTSASPSGPTPKPCPCPWFNTPSRLPWPRSAMSATRSTDQGSAVRSEPPQS